MVTYPPALEGGVCTVTPIALPVARTLFVALPTTLLSLRYRFFFTPLERLSVITSGVPVLSVNPPMEKYCFEVSYTSTAPQDVLDLLPVMVPPFSSSLPFVSISIAPAPEDAVLPVMLPPFIWAEPPEL